MTFFETYIDNGKKYLKWVHPLPQAVVEHSLAHRFTTWKIVDESVTVNKVTKFILKNKELVKDGKGNFCGTDYHKISLSIDDNGMVSVKTQLTISEE